MGKYKLTLALLAGLFMAQFAGAAEVCRVSSKDVLEAVKAEETGNEACTNGEGVTSAALSSSWKCYARDACNKEWTATRVCRDHAENAALSNCESGTRDTGSCRIIDCCPVY